MAVALKTLPASPQLAQDHIGADPSVPLLVKRTAGAPCENLITPQAGNLLG